MQSDNIFEENESSTIKPLKIDFDGEAIEIQKEGGGEEEKEEEGMPKMVPAISTLPPKQEDASMPDPVLRSHSVMDIKYARVMRIGKYDPQKYTTSPPAPPEGYMLDVKVWNDILENSKRMSASISKYYRKRNMEGLVTSTTTMSSAQHPSLALTASSSSSSISPNNNFEQTSNQEDESQSKHENEKSGKNNFSDENDDDYVSDDATDDGKGDNLKMVEVHRKAEIENRKLRKRPVGLWKKAQEKINFAISDVTYGINRIVAKAQDSAQREIRDRTVQRFEELELTPKELEAAGAPLADFYCRAVVEAPGVQRGKGGDRARATPGKTAIGWLFITEKLVIFDGYRVCLPTVPLEGDGHYRFSFQLTKIASFIGAKWSSSTLASATGEVPVFTYGDRLRSPLASPVKQRKQRTPSGQSQQKGSDDVGESKKMEAEKKGKKEEKKEDGRGKQEVFGKKKELGDSSEDAVLIFDQDTLVHQFWDFEQCLANDSRSMMCLLNTAWRTAVLARLN